MRYLITGGSRFDPQIGYDFHALGIDVLQAYGLTETTGAAFAALPHHNVIGSVGPPLPGVEGKIVDPKPRRRWRPGRGRNCHPGRDRDEGLLEPSGRDRRRSERWLAAHRRSRLFRFRRQSVYHRPREGRNRPEQRQERLSRGDRVVLSEISLHQGNWSDGARSRTRQSRFRPAVCAWWCRISMC